MSERIALGALCAVSLLAVYGTVIDFVPSPAWFKWGLVACSALSAVICTLCGFRISARTNDAPTPSRLKRIAALIMLLPVTMVFLSLSVVYGLSDLATRVFGAPLRMSVTLSVEPEHYRGCDYILSGEPVARSLPNAVCLSSEAVPRPVSQVILAGKSGPLGFTIQHVQLDLSDAGTRSQ